MKAFLSRLYWPNMKPTSREPTLMSPAGTSVFSPMWRLSSVMNDWQKRITCRMWSASFGGRVNGAAPWMSLCGRLNGLVMELPQSAKAADKQKRHACQRRGSTSLSERPLGLKSLPPLPPPIGSVVSEFLNTCRPVKPHFQPLAPLSSVRAPLTCERCATIIPGTKRSSALRMPQGQRGQALRAGHKHFRHCCVQQSTPTCSKPRNLMTDSVTCGNAGTAIRTHRAPVLRVATPPLPPELENLMTLPPENWPVVACQAATLQEQGCTYRGVEPQAALVWADCGAELHAVPAVDLAQQYPNRQLLSSCRAQQQHCARIAIHCKALRPRLGHSSHHQTAMKRSRADKNNTAS